MYIDPFVAGVVITLMIEVIIALIAVIVLTVRALRKENERKCRNR